MKQYTHTTSFITCAKWEQDDIRISMSQAVDIELV